MTDDLTPDEQKTKLENDEYASPLAEQERAAAHRKAISDAETAINTNNQSQLASLIPDLSKVTPGKLDVHTDTEPLFASALAHRALEIVAAQAADDVKVHMKEVGAGAVLVTSDPDLATSDALYVDVDTALNQLIATANRLASDEDHATVVSTLGAAFKIENVIEPDAELPAEGAAPVAEGAAVGLSIGGPLAGVAGAIAGAIPGALSLLTANRSVSSYSASIDDIASTSAVCGAIAMESKDQVVLHDDFRLLPDGGIRTKAGELQTLRYKLIGKRIQMAGDVTAAPQGAAAVREGLIDTLLDAIDRFSTALTVVPTGSKRSPLASAALRQELHDKHSGITFVLLVKVASGSSAQVIDDRPLWFDDKFATVTSLSLTYLLIRTVDSHVVCGGTLGGSAAIHGSIGQSFVATLMKTPDINVDEVGDGSQQPRRPAGLGWAYKTRHDS